MRFRGTLALLLVFLGLGAYVYFGEYRGRDERQKQEEAKKKLFTVEEKDISEITLEYPNQVISAVRKGEKDWEIRTPPGLEADAEEWESIARNLAQVQKEESVSEQPGDLAQYGLDKPAIKITAKLQGAEPGRMVSVLFGAENPRKTLLYAKLADNGEVFLTPSSANGFFKKTLTDLRNKQLMDVDAESVDSLKIAVRGRPDIELQKSGMDWKLKQPVDTLADSSEVSSFVSSVQFARASDFADASMDVRKAGLDPPEATITLHDQKLGMDRVLLLGKLAGPDMYFAKESSRPSILIIGKDIHEKARRPVYDWRDKSIARFARDTVDQMEVATPAERLLLKKTGSDWQFADGGKAKQDKIFEMLSSLELDRALEVVDSPSSLGTYGLDPPKVKVTLRAAEKEALVVGFGKEKGSDGVYAKASTSPSVLTVPKMVYEKFNVKKADLVESPAAAEPPAK